MSLHAMRLLKLTALALMMSHMWVAGGWVCLPSLAAWPSLAACDVLAGAGLGADGAGRTGRQADGRPTLATHHACQRYLGLAHVSSFQILSF